METHPRHTQTRIAVIGLLVLLACGLSFASVRMDGLGPGLVDLVDDPVTDLLRYPQLNVLTPGWLVGVETNQPGCYRPYARVTGRLSVVAATDLTLLDSIPYSNPSLAVAVRAWPLSFGVATTGLIAGRMTPPRELIGDTTPHWIATMREIGQVTIGARWRGPGFTLDGNVNGAGSEAIDWHGTRDSVVQVGYYEDKLLTPSIRISWPGEHLRWRGLVSYQCERRGWTGPAWPGSRVSTYHTFKLDGGPTFTAGNLLAAGGLRASVSPLVHLWWWDFCLRAGIEWNPGPVVIRLGADAEVSFTTATTGTNYLGFDGHTYVGLGLRPVERLRLDFAPDMDNAANLRGWELAAAFEF